MNCDSNELLKASDDKHKSITASEVQARQKRRKTRTAALVISWLLLQNVGVPNAMFDIVKILKACRSTMPVINYEDMKLVPSYNMIRLVFF